MDKHFHLSARIICLLRRVEETREAEDDIKPIQSGWINQQLDIGHRCAELSLQTMCRKGLIIGRRGPLGGYRLTDKGKTVDAHGLWLETRVAPPEIWRGVLAAEWVDLPLEAIA